ncbi:MAG: GNAT family N-acetyltransferase, partial [Pseudomonadota bacterium]
MAYIAEQEPTSAEFMAEAEEDGFLWVAEIDGIACGFAVVSVVDSNIHIEEISVHPEFGRRGIGSSLIDFVCREARDRNFVAVTLSTFRDVPWNGPFYERCGFIELLP